MSNFVLIKQSHEKMTIEDPIDKIASVAHNCYQVKEKTHDANFQFLQRLIANKHFAMLEHHMFVYKVVNNTLLSQLKKLSNKFINITDNIISFSLRTPLEIYIELDKNDEISKNVCFSLIQGLPKEIIQLVNESFKTEFKYQKTKIVPVSIDELTKEQRLEHCYLSYRLVTNRGVTHELVRHRICSFAQESTRYCNYTKDKFENKLTFIYPTDYSERKDIYDSYFEKEADTYFKLINSGSKPDQARNVLSNALKATIIVTCNLKEWKHIFVLRCSEFAHQDIRELLVPVKEEVEKYL